MWNFSVSAAESNQVQNQSEINQLEMARMVIYAEVPSSD